jgi:hypothetical protein
VALLTTHHFYLFAAEQTPRKLVPLQGDIVMFSAPLMFRDKAQCATNGYSIGKRCNAVAEHLGSALRVSLSSPMDCVVPFAKGTPFAARHALP